MLAPRSHLFIPDAYLSVRLLFPDPAPIIDAGYSSLAHCPFLIDASGSYPDAANRYLRERALAEWKPKYRINRQDEDAFGLRFLTKKSCEALGKRLVAFFQWCERTGKDWREVDYTNDLVFGWQKAMLDGSGTASGARLSVKTINPRISEASYFLTWAYERGLRPPFKAVITDAAVPKPGSGRTTHLSRRVGTARVGALPEPPSRLVIASPQEVGRWISQIKACRGVVKALCCELIISTGVRISECIQWRVWTLPPHADWELVDGKVLVRVRHGNKGRKLAPASTESARPREVLVPLDLAERIDHYRAFQRPNQLRRWVRSGRTAEERAARARTAAPDQLWLGPKSNRPFSNSQFYQDWRSVPACPVGWHPHAGREFFAVETLVEHTRTMLALHRLESIPSADWLHGLLGGQVRLILQPLMGHVSEDTTNLYLRAIRSRIVLEGGHPALRWQDFCEDGEL